MPKRLPPYRTPEDLRRAFFRARDKEVSTPARLAELQADFARRFPDLPVPGVETSPSTLERRRC